VTIGYKVKLQDFEGPLDLLLFLIRENEVDIYNIPIVEITAQYLATMDQIETVDLELAGDFILMSATLLQIKARMLLPREDGLPEELEDPRQELVQRLLEYRRFREISEGLRGLEEACSGCERRKFFDLGRVDPETRDESLLDVELYDLALIYAELAAREPLQEGHRIELFPYTVEDQVRSIRRWLKRRSSFRLQQIYAEAEDRNLVVVSFLAALDLARQQEILLRQAGHLCGIWVFDPSLMDSWLALMRDSA